MGKADYDLEEFLASDMLDLEGHVKRGADDWQPLEIERDAAEYRAAIESVESAIEAIASDNGYSVSEPAERDAVLASLDNGLDLIKNKNPTLSQVRSLIIAPLTMLVEKFGETLIGTAAKAAGDAIVHWLISILSP